MLDIKIINGAIVDGTGAPRCHGTIGIRDGRIVAIGDVTEPARETINADGLAIAPGFIDVHTHYDAQVFWDPTLSPSCFHGVTTVFGGFCGFSIAPLTPKAGEYLMPMLARVEGMPLSTLRDGVPWDWSSFGSFLDRMENTLSLNAGFFVGHSAVRTVVMDERARGETASPQDMEAMKKLVAESLRSGAMGFSTTVSPSHNDASGNPVPSRFATREELLGLASAVRDFEGTSLELLPDLNFDQNTLDLMTDFSLAGQRPVNWNVLSVNGTSDSDRKRLALQLSASDHARSKGAEVVALTLPRTPTVRINLQTGMIFDALPGWAPLFRLTTEQRIEKLRDPVLRAILESAARTEKGPLGSFSRWENYLAIEIHEPRYKDLQGKNLGEIGSRLGMTPFDALIELSIEDRLRTSFMPQTGGEDAETYKLRAEVWKDNRTILGGSDAGAHMDMIDSFAFSSNLLQKGVREFGVLTLEEAVHQLTQVPASLMGLRERGVIREGWHADLVLFDPATIGCGPIHTRYDLPGNEGRLYADANGIEYVIVNGHPIIRKGQLTEARPGTVLRSGRDSYTVTIPAATQAH